MYVSFGHADFQVEGNLGSFWVGFKSEEVLGLGFCLWEVSGDVGDWCWGGGDVCGGIEDSEESCFCVYLGTSFLEYVSTGRVFGCVRIVSNCDFIDFVLLSWATFAASDFFSTTSSAVASAFTSPSLSL